MRNIKILLISFLFIFSYCNSTTNLSDSQQMIKARLHFFRYWVNPIFDVTDSYDDFWYRDSCLIFKFNTIMLVDKADNSRKRATLETLNYTFINLRNYTCQDYVEFNDTAMPVNNYKLGPADSAFKSHARISDSTGLKRDMAKYTRISDSIENGKKYKRYFTIKTFADSFVVKRMIFVTKENYAPYFRGDMLTTIKLGKNEYITKSIDLHNDTITSASLTENLSNQITPFDIKVFEKWKENNRHPHLPLITANEASKIIFDTTSKIYFKNLENIRTGKN